MRGGDTITFSATAPNCPGMVWAMVRGARTMTCSATVLERRPDHMAVAVDALDSSARQRRGGEKAEGGRQNGRTNAHDKLPAAAKGVAMPRCGAICDEGTAL